MRKDTIKKIGTLFIYAVSMAVVEAAVVVYMRYLFYPAGFEIATVKDLADLPKNVYLVELLREVATIMMLASVGFLAYRKWSARLTAFVWTFSVWDIFYYVFLYVFLRWPPSLSAIDVYFLLPWPLLGPVWFPIALFFFLGAISLWSLLKYRE